MDVEKLRDQMDEGWLLKLSPFIQTKDFDDIFSFLKNQARPVSEGGMGRTICPQSRDVFRAFKETPYKNLKGLMLLQD
jgi:uracil DNA glycosylase